ADSRKAAEHRLPIFGAILLKLAVIDNSRNDFPHVVLLGRIRRKYPVDLLARVRRWTSGLTVKRRSRAVAELIDERANSLDASLVGRLAEIHRTADLRVHFCAAQIFRRGLLPDRS